LELGAFDEVEVVLAPFGTPVRMIESRALDLGVIMGEMHDELIGTRSKRLENFLVCVEPLGLRDAGAKAEDRVENDAIGRKRGQRMKTRVASEESGEFVGFGGGQVDVGETRGTDDGAHVGVEMRDVNASGESFVDLCVHFRFDVGWLGMSDDVRSGEGKITVGIEEAGVLGLRRNGRPAITGPIRVESEMDAEVGVGMGFRPLRDFGKPRAGNEDAGGSDPVIVEGFFGGGVDGVHHTEVVGVDDEEAGSGGIAEALSDGDGVVGRMCWSLSEERSEGKEEDREKTGKTRHGASGF